MAKITGKVWADPRNSKRSRFKAWLTVDNDFLPLITRKTFSTRKAAIDWLTARRVRFVRHF